METKIFDGKAAAQKIKEELKMEALEKGLKPNLAVVLVGDAPGSVSYINRKQKACEELGFGFQLFKKSETCLYHEIQTLIENLNQNLKINGILIQLPLPKTLSAGTLIGLIDKAKEIDGLAPTSLFISPAAQAVIHVLTEEKINIKGAKAVVLGRGKTAGAPIAKALKKRGAKVFVANSKTPPLILTSYLLTSDIIVSAVGKPNLINGGMIKAGTTVISVGMSRLPTSDLPLQNPTSDFPPPTSKVVGDIDEQSLISKASLITPTPGGIGPLTVAFLLKNLLRAAELQSSKSP